MYKKILIATDGKQHSSSAIIEAIEIARKFGSEIYLLHALKKMVVSDQFGISHSVISQKLEEQTFFQRKFYRSDTRPFFMRRTCNKKVDYSESVYKRRKICSILQTPKMLLTAGLRMYILKKN